MIVVGVDGSEGSRKALQWAVHEAHGRGGHVQAVTAWRWDDPELPGDAGAEQKRAEATLAHEVESLPLFQLSGLPITCEVVEGRPGEVLVAAAHNADLLVLGSHGRPVLVLPIHYEYRHETNSRAQARRGRPIGGRP